MHIKVGLVGAGKIASTQHRPAIDLNPQFSLAATADPRGGDYASLDDLLATGPEIDAVILATPPQSRFALARKALQAGKHVLLEKPPAATLAELETLSGLARSNHVSLFAAWHSRYAAGVLPARDWLKSRTLEEVRIIWKEDVRLWHPGQDWIWQPGGWGVFDAGINALSILTALLPQQVHVTGGELSFPANREAPISASLTFGGAPVTAEFDWSTPGIETWRIQIQTREEEAPLILSQGGARLELGGETVPLPETAEYPALYAEFARLIATGGSDADGRPLALVTDAFRLARRVTVAPFHEHQD